MKTYSLVSARLFLAVLLLGAGTAKSWAAFIKPTNATASSFIGLPGNIASPIHLIDGSDAGHLGLGGLSSESATATHANSASVNTTGDHWQSGFGDSTYTVTFTLPDATDLSQFYVWNFDDTDAGTSSRAGMDFYLYVSPDLVSPFVQVTGQVGQDASGAYTLSDATNGLTVSAQTLALSVSNVRRVMFDFANVGEDVSGLDANGNRGNWSGGSGDNFYVQLAEVRFESVPEPSSSIMLIAGIALLAQSRYRRRRSSVLQ